MTSLHYLALGPGISDAGLVHLAKLNELREHVIGVSDSAPATAKRDSKKAMGASAAAVAFKVRATLRGHANAPSNVVFSPDGSLMASVAFNKVLLWDGVSGKKLHPITLKRGALWGAAFTPDSKLFASGSNVGCVFLWETSSGKEKMRLETENTLFTAVDIDPQGKYVAAGGQDGKVYLWELPTGKLLQSFQASAGDFFTAAAFSADGAMLATSGRDSFVALWHIPSGKKATELHGPPKENHYDMIRDVAFRPGDTSLAAVHPDGAIRLWNTSEAKEIAALRCSAPGKSSFPAWALAFHPGGKILATASDGDTLVRLWDVSSRQQIAEFQTGADGNKVDAVAFSPDGKTLATNGKGGSLLLLDVGIG